MKMLKRLSLLATAAVLSLSIVSCNGDKPSSTDLGTDLREISTDTKLDQKVYTLSGPIEVKKGATLTIPAGTTIKAQQGFDKYILVEQGARIEILGTATEPVRIIPEVEGAGEGYWGGLIINGYAPITNGGTNKTEIDPSKPYGGNDINDNSGIITYLVLDGTGARSSANVEHNGLTLNAVGNGTKIENVFIPNAADDGIEFFGGSVNVTNLLVVDSDDDMFDFTEGYSGTLKNAYGIWTKDFTSTESDPRAVEADGNHDGNSPDGQPQADFKIENITVELQTTPSSEEGKYMHDVFKVRRGAKATITNALIIGQGKVKDLVDITDKKGTGNPETIIEFTNKLTTGLSGLSINLGEDIKKAEGIVAVPDNKGTDFGLFAWTGYNRNAETSNAKVLSGAITGTTNISGEVLLSGSVEVKKGGVLNIAAGTTIKAQNGFENYILVEQGGKINVNGTAEKPVRMVPLVKDAGQGYWGGLIINGYAPITNGGTNKTEIDPSKPYGGSDPSDNSGVITYLVLDGTGARSSADKEHNGLTLNGVGNGTKIENIFVINGADDAIEFFGGTVNVTNILAVDADDDLFDFTEGYSGTLTNAYGIWRKGFMSSESDPRGIEADGNHDGNSPNGTPQANFKVDGITIDLQLDPSKDEGYYMHDVFKIRRGATATITNALIKGQGQAKDIIDMTDKKGAGNPNTKIEYTLDLKTPFSGKEINGDVSEGNVVKKTALKGADASKFAWTGYKL